MAYKQVFDSWTFCIMGRRITTACILKSNSVLHKDLCKVKKAYTFANDRYKERLKVEEEVLGKRKMQIVVEALSKKHLEDAIFRKRGETIRQTRKGNVLCYDEVTKRSFYCSALAINNALMKLICKKDGRDVIPLNDFFLELNLEEIPDGYSFGWKKKDAKIYCTPILKNKNPILCIRYDLELLK